MFASLWTKLYLALGVGAILSYATVEVRGMVFSGTDRAPSLYSGSSSSGSRSGGGGGGVFFWGSGYRGGK